MTLYELLGTFPLSHTEFKDYTSHDYNLDGSYTDQFAKQHTICNKFYNYYELGMMHASLQA